VPRIFVTSRLPGDGLGRLDEAGHEVDVWPGELPPSPAELRAGLAGAGGLLCSLADAIDADLLAAAPELRAIANYAVGSDNIDLEAARERGIPVGVTPGVLTDATAELAWALMLAAARRLPEAARYVRAGEWRTWETSRWLGAEISGATLLVVGRGRIGQAVARRAEGWDLRVILTGRGEPPPWEEADLISLHTPLTPETRGLVGAEAFARMKPTAILVNTARGPVVDRDALRDALVEGRIAGAALDVTDPEPLPADDPLQDIPNLLVVPHIGSATHTARTRMVDLCVANLLAGLAGEPMPYGVGGAKS
jgi:glyoxylate reductase